MKFIFLLSCLWIFSGAIFSETQHFLTKDQIIMTDSGFFFLIDEFIISSPSITYMGNGIYAAEYYGQCNRCGGALDKNGKCGNKKHTQYGPGERK